MPDAYVKVSSAWKRVVRPYVKVSSTWKGVNKAYVKVGSVWKLFFEYLTGNVVGGNFARTILGPGTATCSFRQTTGGAEQHNSSGAFVTSNASFLMAGHTAAEYDIRYNPTGDTSFMTGDAIGSTAWLNCGTQHTWSVATNVPNVPRTVTGLVSIRRAGGGSVIDSATVILEAEVAP